MKREACDCDICSSEDVRNYYSFALDVEAITSGTNRTNKNIDVCNHCAMNVLEAIAKRLNEKRDYALNNKIMITLSNLHLDGE